MYSDETHLQAFRLIRSALTHSERVIKEDPTLRVGQLVGRLARWRGDNPLIRALTDRLMTEEPGIYPLFPDGEYTVLNQAGMGLLQRLEGHIHGVNHVAVTPDGQTAVSASQDGKLRVWELKTGICLHVLDSQGSSVSQVVVTSDKHTAVAIVDDKHLAIWDLVTVEMRHHISYHSDTINRLVLTPDGKSAVTASNDGLVIVSDLISGKFQHVLSRHTGIVTDVAVSTDGEIAVSVSEDRTIYIWDLTTGSVRRELFGHESGIYQVALSSDGKTIVSLQTIELWVWDVKTGRYIYVFKENSDEFNIDNLIITPDNQTVVFSSASRYSSDLYIQMCDLKTGACRRIVSGHLDSISQIAITPDGQTLISASNDQTVRVWDFNTGACLQVLYGHSGAVNHVAVSPDGYTLVSASQDKNLYVWDIRQAHRSKPDVKTSHLGSVTDLQVLPNSKTAVSVSTDGSVGVWDTAIGQLRLVLRSEDARISQVVITPDGHTAVAALLSTLQLWNLTTGQYWYSTGSHYSSVSHIALTPDGQTILSSSSNGLIWVWDVLTFKQQRSFSDHTTDVNYLAISADGKTALSASKDTTVRVWDITSGLCHHVLSGHSAEVTHVMFTPDGKTAVSTSQDYTLRVWDIATGECRYILDNPQVQTSHLLPDGKTLITQSVDVLHVWDVSDGRKIATFPNTVTGWITLTQNFPDLSDFAGVFQHHDGYGLLNLENRLFVLSPVGEVMSCFMSDAPITHAKWLTPGKIIIAGDKAGRVMFLKVVL